jgi:hypothetical protein
MKYKFYVHDNVVICVTTYRKKFVKATAKCAPEDTFDIEYGKKLAQARVDLKVAQKKLLHARDKHLDIYNKALATLNQLDECEKFVEDCMNTCFQSELNLKLIEKEKR